MRLGTQGLSPCLALFDSIFLTESESVYLAVRTESLNAILVFEDRAIAQAAIRPLTANVRVPVPVNTREICGGQIGTGAGFSLITSVSSRQYHSTRAS